MAEGRVRAALFATCLVDQFFADEAADAVRLLRHLGVEVEVPLAQTCCGQPAWNAGYRAEAERMARHTLDVFDRNEYVVLPSGSCTAMLRSHYPTLLASDPEAAHRVDALRSRTYELSEFIVQVLQVTSTGRGLSGRRIVYHHGCHALREAGPGLSPITLLEGAGAQVVPWEADRECCGFGGLFAVKHPEVSAGMADRKTDTLPAGIEVVTSADGGCLMQLAGRLHHRGGGPPVRHLAALLWESARA